MDIFEELERLKKKEITVVVMVQSPDLKGDVDDLTVLVDQILIGPTSELEKQHDDPDAKVTVTTGTEGESIKDLMYRAVIEFDEAYPEYL